MVQLSPKAAPRNTLAAVGAALACALLGASGCSPYLGTTASSFMLHANSNDANIRYLAYEKLGSPRSYDNDSQKRKATKMLVERLSNQGEPIATRAILCRTLGELRAKEALPALRGALGDGSPVVRAEAARALGKIGEHDDEVILSRIAVADTQQECRIAAIDGIGTLKSSNPAVLTTLLDLMSPKSDAALRFAAHQAIVKSVGKDLGVELEPWQKEIEQRIAAARAGAAKAAVAKPSETSVKR